MYRMSFFAALALIATLLTAAGCSPTHRSSHLPTDKAGFSENNSAEAPTLIVTDANGTPLAGAAILIGPRENVPFPGNLLTTDANGMVPLPTDWIDGQPLTVEAPGYVRTTWMSQVPAPSMIFAVRTVPKNQQVELTGKTTGYKNLQKDGWVDVGVVFPAVRRNQLASLQVTDLISPDVDIITIFGQSVEIPSNVSIPQQTERYYFNITLDKPVYRSYLSEPRTWKMVATHARFPFEKVLDDLRAGKEFYEVLNHFEFKSATLDDINLVPPSTKKDIAIGAIKFQPKIDVTAPKFDPKYGMLAVSLADNSGLLYPTDVKSLAPRETRRLVAPTTVGGYVVGALRDIKAPTSGPGADELSAIMIPTNQTTPFEFLEIPAAPKVVGQSLVLDPPAASVAAVTPAATYATLSQVDTRLAGSTKLDVKIPIWDVYASGWATSLDLPEMPTQAKGSYRWEVLFGGASSAATVQLGPNLVEGLSHVSKSATDL